MPFIAKADERQCAAVKICNLYDTDFYGLMRRIADIILDEYTKMNAKTDPGKPWLVDQRHKAVDSTYDQTADGLYLQLSHGVPSSLWTPWGNWQFGGSGGGWSDVLPSLLERFDARLYQSPRTSELVDFGPVYALHKVDAEPLREPSEIEERLYTSCKKLEFAWNILTKCYQDSVRS